MILELAKEGEEGHREQERNHHEHRDGPQDPSGAEPQERNTMRLMTA